MVTTSGFTNAPGTRALLTFLVSASLATSILDLKPYLPLKPTPHLWPYLQLWRIPSFQLAYTSSTELLFSAAIIYQLRALERIWGSRKFTSFILASYGLCMASTISLGLLLKILTLGWWGYIPSGMTPIIVSTVAVWRRETPHLGGFKILLDDDSNTNSRGIELSDKWTIYLLTAQLTFSQFPYGLLPALVGWIVGNAWADELVPAGLVRWRVPAWVVGEDTAGKRGRGQQYEGLRRRLEEEGQDGMREVSDGITRGGGGMQEAERRGRLGGVGRYFGGGGT